MQEIPGTCVAEYNKHPAVSFHAHTITRGLGSLTPTPGHIRCVVPQVDYIKGFGKLGGPNTVNVDLTEGGMQSLETKNIIIATGSEVTPLPPVPVDNAQQKIVDSTGALDLKEVMR